jgi:hypothetical protein
MRKKNTEPLHPSTYYHIYNRGINGEPIFKEPKNYTYFLQLYAKYIPLIADTYAYCLLGNHFHLLIKIRSEEEIMHAIVGANYTANSGRVLNPPRVQTKIQTASSFTSLQFSKLFNSYAQAINKAYQRTGGLFEDPFRRIPVASEKYFTQMIYYIHANPKKHGFCEDFTEYPHSSYNAFILERDTKLKREEVLDWFGNKEQFVKFHQQYKPLVGIEKITEDL